MKLRFNPEAKVTEFSEGNFYLKNEGQPIEVTPILGESLLRKNHINRLGEEFPVFVKDEPKVEKAAAPEAKTAEVTKEEK